MLSSYSTQDEGADDEVDPTCTIQGISNFIAKFAADREWDRFHKPRNLALALMGELGELAELFQWKGDSEMDGCSVFEDEHEKDHVGQELADVAIYCLRLATVCDVDLGNVCENVVSK